MITTKNIEAIMKPPFIWLDGRQCADKTKVWPYLRQKLQLPEYFGDNLDALWDVLSERGPGCRYVIFHANALVNSEMSVLLRLFDDLGGIGCRIYRL